MPTYKMLIEYHGAPFRGWMRQPDLPTVQGRLEAAAAKIDGAPVEVFGAGRTDSGVHATGQVAHMHLQTDRGRKVADAMNFHLRPDPICVLSAEEVNPEFHSRFDAVQRHYRYVVVNRRAHMTLENGLVWRVSSQLDAALMDRAAQRLIGHHDFTTFRDQLCQARSPMRTLDVMTVARYGDRIEFTISARSFLHRMVRSLVGSLVDVGRGKEDEAWIGAILEAKDRTRCGPIAPPDGLFLERVDYP
jgi:tRNA pseudouridine38-40 synthase